MFKKYSFKKYNKNYPKLFNIERKRLIKILPKNAKIKHIGSTAVPNLGGKGIIDIIISVNKNKINSIKNKLIKFGCEFKEKAGEKDRLFFEKDYKNKEKIRRVHIQLTEHNSKIWKNSIKFRDLLRNNELLTKKYSELKRRAVKLKKQGKDYRKFKEKFIREILKYEII
ncbi:GrpB family protein [Candidatus Pacearchaeota archaeon]|nr:GrpB family protein [Candidatus Pacearchaeota archaeon]